MSVVKLGVIAKDLVTGFTGLVTAYAVHLSNCDRAILTPRELKDDGTPKEGFWFDVTHLEFVEGTDVPITSPVCNTIRNGDNVKHVNTGFKGLVVGVNTWINGCVRIGVQSPELIKGSMLEDTWLPCQELEVIEVQKVAEPAKEKKVGGPMKAPKAMSNPK
jgi:hypothetical protein